MMGRSGVPQQARRPRARTEHGAAAIEFALIVPLVLMVIIGAITTGISYSNAIGATNAVREGTRFGATGDASQSTWASDVISRVRTTQFDDTGNTTAICVQLWKQGTGSLRLACSNGAAQTLNMPSSTDYPAVPSGLAAGQCVVRVIAARPFTINAVVANWNAVATRGSIARYERIPAGSTQVPEGNAANTTGCS
jgi:Flp pilus assembly protein TadG